MKLYNERTTKDFLWITVLYSVKVNEWPRSLNLSTTRTGATSDLDNAEAYLLYEINLHLHFETNQKHYGYQNTNLFNLYASSKELQLYTVIY